MQGVVETLTRNLLEESVSCELLASLERGVSSFAEPAEPRPKRQKLDGSAGSLLSVEDKLTACCALKNIIQGQSPHPQLWGRLCSTESDHLVDFILQVSLPS